jgi:hypothetical protein
MSKDTDRTGGVDITSDANTSIGGDVAGRDIIKTVVNVVQGSQGVIIVALVALVAIVGVVALSGNARSDALATTPATLPAIERETQTTSDLSTEPPRESLAPATTQPNCIDDYLAEVAPERVISLEAGAGEQSLPIAEADRSGSDPLGPLGVRFTQVGQPIGALKFLTLREGTSFIAFSITSVIDSDCQEVDGYVNVIHPSAGSTLQNWDTLEVPLPTGVYGVRFGWQGFRIRISFR